MNIIFSSFLVLFFITANSMENIDTFCKKNFDAYKSGAVKKINDAIIAMKKCTQQQDDQKIYPLLLMKTTKNDLVDLIFNEKVEMNTFSLASPIINSPPNALALQDDMLFLYGDNKIMCINSETKEGHYFDCQDPVYDMTIKQESEKSIVVTAHDKHILFWDPFSGPIFNINNAHGNQINKIEYCNANNFFSCSNDGSLKKWDDRTQKPVKIWDHDSAVNSFSYNNQNNTITTITENGKVNILELKKGTCVQQMKAARALKKVVNTSDFIFFLLKNSKKIDYYDVKNKNFFALENSATINDFVCIDSDLKIAIADEEGYIKVWKKNNNKDS